MIMDEQVLITTSGQKENLRRSIGFWVLFVLPKRTMFSFLILGVLDYFWFLYLN